MVSSSDEMATAVDKTPILPKNKAYEKLTLSICVMHVFDAGSR